jgi:hypothetical protein
LACDVTDETNDQKQAVPLAEVTWETLAPVGIERPKDDRGEPAAMVAMLDNGYYSEAGAKALEKKGFDPYIAAGRLPHHGVPHEVPESPQTAKEHMAAKDSNARRLGGVRQAQGHRRAGVWADQRRTWLSPLLVAGTQEHSR